MFEDLFKELDTLKSISVPIGTDNKGYVDRQCPSEECKFLFKVSEEDWANIFQDEVVFCPLCRHEATSDQWFTIEQIEHSKDEALTVISGKISNALHSGAEKFNKRQPKNSFISMSLKVQGSKKRTYVLPTTSTKEMQLDIQCEECSSRFAVIGSAYFCPACGHNSVTRTYSDSLRKIKVKKENISIIRQNLVETVGEDEAELVRRSLIETCISDGVVAFQRYCEGLYEKYGKIPFNAFQNLEKGSKLWKTAIGYGYEKWLSSNELRELNILFQKRHLLAHQDGIVDIKYITKTGDTYYTEGQRIVISEQDIDKLLSYLTKLSEGLEGIK